MARQADAIIVHHGYFWKSEPAAIKGMKRRRLRTLLANDINLYGWHLPLDAHPELGNNAQLAKLLDIEVRGEVMPLVFWGELAEPLSGEQLARRKELYEAMHPDKSPNGTARPLSRFLR